MFQSRWKWLLCFFATEVILAHVAMALLGCNSLKDLGSVPARMVSWHLLLIVIPTMTCIIALQMAFLTPVTFPTLRTDSKPGLKRLLLSGFAVTVLVVTPVVYGFSIVFNFFSYHKPNGIWEWALQDQPWVTVAVLMVLLGPVVTLGLRRKWSNGVPIKQSLWIAGLTCGLLVGGFSLLLISLAIQLGLGDATTDDNALLVLLLAPLVGWVCSAPILYRFASKSKEDTVLDRIARRLLLGTVIEVAAIIPVDIMVRRKTDCYCWEPTYFSLVLCGSAGLIALGPAIFLVVGRRRASFMSGRCPVCEYDMSGFPYALRCPECGSGWKLTNVSVTPLEDGSKKANPPT